MLSDDSAAVDLAAHYLCAVPVSHVNSSEEEEGAAWEKPEGGWGCSVAQSGCKDVLPGEGALHVEHPGKLISLCRGLQASFSK